MTVTTTRTPLDRRACYSPRLRTGVGARSRAGGPAAAVRRSRRAARLVRRRSGLTRRGRLLLVLAVAALLFAAFSLGRVSTSAATSADRDSLQRVAVQPGETLWQLATRVAPQADPRVTVRRLMDLNHLDAPDLRVGQALLVPRR